MCKYVWKESLSVGDEQIDDDHKELFALVNELKTADMSRDFLSGIIERLINYAKFHFSREEKYMITAGYPESEEHIKEHQQFNEWINSVKTTYTRAPESPFIIGEQVNLFVTNWLVNHIMKVDMKYRDFILKKQELT